MARPKAPEKYRECNVALYERHLRWLGNRNKSAVIRDLIDYQIRRGPLIAALEGLRDLMGENDEASA